MQISTRSKGHIGNVPWSVILTGEEGVSTPVIAAMLQSKSSGVSAAVTTTPTPQANPTFSTPGQSSIAPASADALVSQGNTLYQSGQYAEALQSFDGALQIDPQFPRALYGRAVTEDTLRRPGDAIRAYRKFIKVASPPGRKFGRHCTRQAVEAWMAREFTLRHGRAR